jgi:hypothetical protein
MINENFKKLIEKQKVIVKEDGLYPTTGIDIFGFANDIVNECISVLTDAGDTDGINAIKSHFELS